MFRTYGELHSGGHSRLAGGRSQVWGPANSPQAGQRATPGRNRFEQYPEGRPTTAQASQRATPGRDRFYQYPEGQTITAQAGLLVDLGRNRFEQYSEGRPTRLKLASELLQVETGFNNTQRVGQLASSCLASYSR